jgi:hypothetical protein
MLYINIDEVIDYKDVQNRKLQKNYVYVQSWLNLYSHTFELMSYMLVLAHEIKHIGFT